MNATIPRDRHEHYDCYCDCRIPCVLINENVYMARKSHHNIDSSSHMLNNIDDDRLTSHNDVTKSDL